MAKKYFFRVTICLLILLTGNAQACPIGSSKSGDFCYEVNSNNEATMTSYRGPAGAVVIPDTIEGYPVTTIGIRAFYKRSDVTDITIPESVTWIRTAAFYECSALTTINIPDNVSRIGEEAFNYCSDLSSVTLGDKVSEIGWRAFSNCPSLTSINIPDSVTSIGGSAFASCSALTSITIPNGVEFINSSVFQSCTALTSTVLPDGIIAIGEQAFQGCSALTSINIPNSVIEISREAFAGCSSLTSITIPDSLSTISELTFSSCSALTDVTIPESVTTIGSQAFFNCTSLTGVTLPDSLTTIWYGAFDGCTALSSVAIPKSVTSIMAGTFYNCSALISITIPENVTTIGEYAFVNCENLSTAYFLGDAPSMESPVFEGTAPDFNICYTAEASGFTTPAWEGYPAADCACSYDTDCTENEICVDGVCIANEAPIFLSEPRWPYGHWPKLSSDPANPNKPQSQDMLFFAYDDDGNCQGIAPEKRWMYRPVELQEGGGVLPLDEWTIEVPGWSFMYWVLIKEPTLADITGTGLFELKISVTDCLDQVTDSEGFYGKRYYIQVN